MYNFRLLRKTSLFKNLDDEMLSDIMKHFKTQMFNKNTTIFYQKDLIKNIYLVITGRVEVNKYDFEGTKSIITFVHKYEVFGESMALAANNVSRYNAVCLEDCKIAYIAKDDFLELVKQYPILIDNMIEVLASKNSFMTFKLECLSKKNIKEKVFEVLRYYSIIQNTMEVVLPFNKTQLAEFLFINRSALSRELTKMQEEGIFRYENHYYYLNEEFFD